MNPFHMECSHHFNSMPVESRIFLDINTIHIGENGNNINNTFRSLLANDLSLVFGISKSRIDIHDVINKAPATLVKYIISKGANSEIESSETVEMLNKFILLSDDTIFSSNNIKLLHNTNRAMSWPLPLINGTKQQQPCHVTSNIPTKLSDESIWIITCIGGVIVLIILILMFFGPKRQNRGRKIRESLI